MKESVLVLLIFFTAWPTRLLAQDGATLYKSKCAVCHAIDGTGRKAIKGTNLLADAVKRRTDAQIADAIGNGAKIGDGDHAYLKKGLTKEQVTALVGHIRSLQKK